MSAGSGYTLHKWWNPKHEFDFVPDVVVNNVSVGEKMTPAHIAIQNCREKKHSTPVPAFPEIERKAVDWWKRVWYCWRMEAALSYTGSL